jgi:predicted O-methyltransferase YrrM
MNIVQLYGDTAQFDFAPWYGTRDLVFVDACHEYEYVRNDTDIALRLSRSGGLIIWHDYGSWVGVTRALNEFHAHDSRFRLIRHIAGTSICFLEVSRAEFEVSDSSDMA